jgi:transketolase C-terminal domain/subunit
MANLKPQYSSDVSTLKADFNETCGITEKAKTKTTVQKSYNKYIPAFLTTNKNTKIENKEHRQLQVTTSQNRDVKIIKVIKYADITNYSLTHKQLTKLRHVGGISRTEIIKIANSVKAQKVLIYVLRDTRYIYFYQN